MCKSEGKLAELSTRGVGRSQEVTQEICSLFLFKHPVLGCAHTWLCALGWAHLAVPAGPSWPEWARQGVGSVFGGSDL